MALGGAWPALVVFTAVPMALAGGVFALALRGIPFSITASVGFIALSGVAVLNGLVMMSAIRKRLDAGEGIDGAIIGGAMERVRSDEDPSELQSLMRTADAVLGVKTK